MNIAIDFDETLTRDAELWCAFVRAARKLDHRILCVTSRPQTEDDVDTVDEWFAKAGFTLPVYFCSHESKVAYMASLGIKIDIWIDDDPKRCAMGF